MTDERYKQANSEHRVTPEELAAGWHFCRDWDDMLIGPGWGELEFCHCKNIPKELKLEAEKANNWSAARFHAEDLDSLPTTTQPKEPPCQDSSPNSK